MIDTALTPKERRQLLADLDAAGVLHRPSPVTGNIEVMNKLTSLGGEHVWHDVEFTRQAVADVIAPFRIEAKTPTGYWLMPHRYRTQEDRVEAIRLLRNANPGRRFRAYIEDA